MDTLEEFVHVASNPNSPTYGKQKNREEISSLVQNIEAVDALLRYLSQYGVGEVVHRSLADEYITVRGKVVDLERLFGVQLFEYHAQRPPLWRGQWAPRPLVRTERYHLPEDLLPHVEGVFQLIDFPDTPNKIHLESSDSSSSAMNLAAAGGCGSGAYTAGYVQPCFLNELYDIRNNSGKYYGTQAIYGALEQTVSPSDLATFQQSFGLPSQSLAHNYGGHVNDSTCVKSTSQCAEANLDVQYITAVAQSVPTWYYYWNGTETWASWLVQVASMATPPLVFSISYASYEASLSKAIIASFQREAIKLSAMGVTLVASSGDDGVAGWLVRDDSSLCGYNPQFPASSPYVTAVGGTQVKDQAPFVVAVTVAVRLSVSCVLCVRDPSRAQQRWRVKATAGESSPRAAASRPVFALIRGNHPRRQAIGRRLPMGIRRWYQRRGTTRRDAGTPTCPSSPSIIAWSSEANGRGSTVHRPLHRYLRV